MWLWPIFTRLDIKRHCVSWLTPGVFPIDLSGLNQWPHLPSGFSTC
jgi:hypothetical protein